MADEISVRSALEVDCGNVQYKSEPQSYTVDLTATKGPSPGAVAVTTVGTNISFSQLNQPGWCKLVHLGEDEANWVSVGLSNGSEFWHLLKLRPGKPLVFEFSDFFGLDSMMTGTGTGGISDVVLRMVAMEEATNVSIEAFDADPL